MHQVHTLNPGCAPTAHALCPCLCACSACCVPTQATVCLLSLLYATIQPSLLCAYLAFYMPQYSRAYCVPTQPSICHNTAEPIMCLLSLLYACSSCCVPVRLLYACSAFSLSHNTASVLQHTCLNFPPGYNTLQCIMTYVPQPC